MYELACPACNSPSQYDFNDYLLMCPFCSCTFRVDHESGQKEIFGDHYIVSNTSNQTQVNTLVLEWLKRLNHKPGGTDREYFVSSIKGLSVPFWIVSMEVHTYWKGLVQRQTRTRLESVPGCEYLVENSAFKRNYRWAISARHNICESWGMTRLHEAKEQIPVNWDGFPLDSTFSRGQIQEADLTKAAYEAREFFEFKFANGLPIVGVQVTEDEALRRARQHVEQYHLELSRLNVDFLTDFRTDIEIAGVQLVHLPFWHASYVYRPRTVLRHFYRPKERKVLVEGYSNGILAGELAIQRRDKMWINASVSAAAAFIMLMLGIAWHPAFLLVALFAAVIAGGSAYIAVIRGGTEDKLDPSNVQANLPVGKRRADGAAA